MGHNPSKEELKLNAKYNTQPKEIKQKTSSYQWITSQSSKSQKIRQTKFNLTPTVMPCSILWPELPDRQICGYRLYTKKPSSSSNKLFLSPLFYFLTVFLSYLGLLKCYYQFYVFPAG